MRTRAFQRSTLRRSHRRGTALVEMAIVLPLLILLLLGIIEFGNIMFVRHNLVNAATQGARLGLLDGIDEDEVISQVKEVLADAGFANLGVDISADFEVIDPNPPDEPGRTTVKVVADSTYAEASIFGGFLPDSLVLHASCTMVK